ncbi:MAG TPA: hypothetical protein PLZ37_00795 [Nitrospira sp.]|nr:hypothetical protein [Nitrospira sp.]
MSSTPHPPFRHLRNKIHEWKAGDLLQTGEQSWQQFRQIAPLQLTPIVMALQDALQAEGLQATIHNISEERHYLNLLIEPFDIAITFGPDENPHLFHLSACRRANPEDECKALISYQDLELNLGHVIAIVEDVVLRILGPRRAIA